MAGAGDKARFYLEQLVPELQDLAKKEIFSSDEITAVTKKRSDFEHILNARGSSPADWARYAEYEMNLDALKRKRAKRLGIKATGHTGPRRIFYVLDRATKKFHGDVALWMQYLRFARDQKAFKKSSKILASALRFHPTRPELWIYAARYAMDEQGDMTEARSYMQRGLRFCQGASDLWLAYARLELIYAAKIAARRRILGLDSRPKEKLSANTSDKADKPNVPDEEDTEYIALPVLAAENMDSDNPDGVVDSEAQALKATPTSSGAIVMAIFDAAMDHFNDSGLGERFFDLVIDFDTIPCQANLLQHLLDRLTSSHSTSPSTLNCFVRQPMIGIDRHSFTFPRALGTSIGCLKQATGKNPSSSLARKSIIWMAEHLRDPDLDQDLRKVLSMTIGTTLKQYLSIHRIAGEGSGDEMLHLLEDVKTCGLDQLASMMATQALDIWPSCRGLQQFEKSGRASTDEH